MKKLVEHTYGLSIFMRMDLDGKEEEITVYLRNGGEHTTQQQMTYNTTADDDPKRREQIITAFHAMY